MLFNAVGTAGDIQMKPRNPWNVLLTGALFTLLQTVAIAQVPDPGLTQSVTFSDGASGGLPTGTYTVQVGAPNGYPMVEWSSSTGATSDWTYGWLTDNAGGMGSLGGEVSVTNSSTSLSGNVLAEACPIFEYQVTITPPSGYNFTSHPSASVTVYYQFEQFVGAEAVAVHDMPSITGYYVKCSTSTAYPGSSTLVSWNTSDITPYTNYDEIWNSGIGQPGPFTNYAGKPTAAYQNIMNPSTLTFSQTVTCSSNGSGALVGTSSPFVIPGTATSPDGDFTDVALVPAYGYSHVGNSQSGNGWAVNEVQALPGSVSTLTGS
jgi:hypothetical protein